MPGNLPDDVTDEMIDRYHGSNPDDDDERTDLDEDVPDDEPLPDEPVEYFSDEVDAAEFFHDDRDEP